MKTVYNPKDGAVIKDFIFNSMKIEPHFPEGSGVNGESTGLMRYEDDVAEALVNTYQFLQIIEENVPPVQSSSAEPLVKVDSNQFVCSYPGCSFSTATKIAFLGHSRKHNKSDKAESGSILPLASSSLSSEIPIAKSTHINIPSLNTDSISEEDRQTVNGLDKDGVEWYGDGVKEEKASDFSLVQEKGVGHF